MTNSFIGLLNSIFLHLLLFAILITDFSIFAPQQDRIKTIPVEFVNLPIDIENIPKKINNIKNELLENNIQKKKLIDELKTIDKKKFDFDTRKNLENQIAETKFLNEKREVQIRIALIQERINSIWKKPSLINKNIQAEFIINLAPSGEILSFDLISSSGEKVFDDSALAALSKIYFITEVIGLERKYFERNFRSFNLVFKSKNQ
tara:strand:+ start:3254 stop:3868 length:615 start_codon:yes stop_codon:yes gene_type:complete